MAELVDIFQEKIKYIKVVLGNKECIKRTKPGPSCSKLTMSLVNDSLKFTSSDTQIR